MEYRYTCPCYYYPLRQGAFVVAVHLPTGKETPEFWVKRATALLCTTSLLSRFKVRLLPGAVRAVQFGLKLASLIQFFAGDYPHESIVQDGQCFDFIVVGAGSAGCVVASRLSEVSNVTVLLIGAGDNPDITAVATPKSLYIFTLPNKEWQFNSVNDGYSSQAHETGTIHHTMGKMLGGTSSTNGMYYVRWHPNDYQKWVDYGNKGWDWHTVLKYFEKSERMTDEDNLKR